MNDREVPEVFATWKNEGLKEPEIREQFGPDKPNRTIVILSLESGNESGNKMPELRMLLIQYALRLSQPHLN